jgi:hypothetical protein
MKTHDDFDYAGAALIDQELYQIEKRDNSRAVKRMKLAARAAEGRDVSAYMQTLAQQEAADRQREAQLQAEARQGKVSPQDRPEDYVEKWRQ